MNKTNEINPTPIIVFGCFIIGGLFLDAVLSIPIWAHRGFEVLWIGFWGSLVIYWIIRETQTKANATNYHLHDDSPDRTKMVEDVSTKEVSILDADKMITIYRQYTQKHQ